MLWRCWSMRECPEAEPGSSMRVSAGSAPACVEEAVLASGEESARARVAKSARYHIENGRRPAARVHVGARVGWGRAYPPAREAKCSRQNHVWLWNAIVEARWKSQAYGQE